MFPPPPFCVMMKLFFTPFRRGASCLMLFSRCRDNYAMVMVIAKILGKEKAIRRICTAASTLVPAVWYYPFYTVVGKKKTFGAGCKDRSSLYTSNTLSSAADKAGREDLHPYRLYAVKADP